MIALEISAARLHLEPGVVLQHDFQFMIAAVELQVLRRETQHIDVFRLRGNPLQPAGEIVVVVEVTPAGVRGEFFQDVHDWPGRPGARISF